MANASTQLVGTVEPSALYTSKHCGTLAPTMMRLTVKEVAEKEGITSAKELSKRTGLHYESCRLIWNGTSRRIDLDTLEALCDALNVGPAQLFEYKREPAGEELSGAKRKG